MDSVSIDHFKNWRTLIGFSRSLVLCVCTHTSMCMCVCVCISGWRKSASLSRNLYDNLLVPEMLKLQLLESYAERTTVFMLTTFSIETSFIFLTPTFPECRIYSLALQQQITLTERCNYYLPLAFLNILLQVKSTEINMIVTKFFNIPKLGTLSCCSLPSFPFHC